MSEKFAQKMQEFSHLTEGNISYIEALYDTYLKDPNAVDGPWHDYFAKMAIAGKPDVVLSDVREHFYKLGKTDTGLKASATAPPDTQALSILQQERKQAKIHKLINAYRSHGHHQAKLDPLEIAERKDVPDLHLNYHGFSTADLDTQFSAAISVGTSSGSLRAIHDALTKTYCNTIGVEFMHITNVEERHWIQQRLESVHSRPTLSPEEKLHILQYLTAAEGLERYLGAKYVGQTRFSLEGGVSLVPMLDTLIQHAGKQGVKEAILGMGHRGRLNVLVNNMGKSPQGLFKEFEGKSEASGYSGDVKYHLGFSSNIRTSGGIIHVALAFNPSHLEIINPVVEGSVRARQDRRADYDHTEVVPILIHGDAAFAGQGVVMETFAFSQARGFRTGGTLHIVVNNQIGFTTSNPLDSRSSLYCTDIAKMVQAPIFHVNGDDPEAVVFVAKLALDYRMQFKKDVLLDLVCYRRHGHNEADEPSATQPLMYRKIKQRLRTREIYSQQLATEKIITTAESQKMLDDYRKALESGKSMIDLVSNVESGQIFADWKTYKDHDWNIKADTCVAREKLTELGTKITTIPDGFVLQKQVQREFENRRKMVQGELPLNWGCGETLAFATLLNEGYPIRLSGQDSRRGTFAHRHAVLHDQNDGKEYTPLQHLDHDQQQATFTVIDSILSEEAVMGFEYGYATTEPETLVIWEAQYGDFANGAQVVMDQFICSGEQKWGRLCGLSLFLPHGYEGAGPEHSSARIERFLQSSAQKNIQVCVPTTPAQIFHLIRRQILRPFRKPLVVFTPKSLLRHKLAISDLTELSSGGFQLLIPEIDKIAVDEVKRVILCSGKIYYDLLQKRREQQQSNVAIVRVEQLYPFPQPNLEAELKRYKKASEVVWCQEEPKNQGAWYQINHHLMGCLTKGQTLRYVGRVAQAAPATGYTSAHLQEQAKLVDEALRM